MIIMAEDVKKEERKQEVKKEEKAEIKKEFKKAEPKEHKAKEHREHITGRTVVRLYNTDLDGSLPVERALRKIKGISFMFAKGLCTSTGTDPKKPLIELNEEERRIIENAVKNPQIPRFLLNRRKDTETGKDLHLISTDLDFRKREDIHFMRKIRCYRGIRHELGQPVRGQRTRSSFRTQKTVGVVKKKAMPGSKPAEKK